MLFRAYGIIIWVEFWIYVDGEDLSCLPLSRIVLSFLSREIATAFIPEKPADEEG